MYMTKTKIAFIIFNRDVSFIVFYARNQRKRESS